MKPAMNGVFLSIDDQNANFVSSDSHRLVRYRRTDLSSQTNQKIIIHRKALQLLKSVLPSERVQVNLQLNESNAVFSFRNYKLICRLIEERFPEYENVIPLNNDNTLLINRAELLSTLKRINIYANKSTNQVRFKIEGDKLKVSAEDLDFSNEAAEELNCEHSGEDLEIGFNARFLIEVLNNLSTERVQLKLSAPGMAGLVLPEEQADDEDVLMLVMPIMLHNYAS
jgi:DNA polymerase-3 subunit beta